MTRAAAVLAVLAGVAAAAAPTALVRAKGSAALPALVAKNAALAFHDAPFGAAHEGLVEVRADGLAMLEAAGIEYKMVLEDLDATVAASFAANQAARAKSDDFFAAFRTYEEYLNLMEETVARFPNMTELLGIGSSFEGREIYALHVHGQGSSENKPGIIHVAAQHAREHLTPPVVAYTWLQLLENYETDGDIARLVDTIDWWFVPVVNPDGYEYTFTGPNERTHRKSMRVAPAGSPPQCFGIDLNRNWGVDFGGPYSSGDPCSGNYRGTERESEPEVKAVADFIRAHPRMTGLMDWHTSGDLALYPFGYTQDPSDDVDLLHETAEEMAQACFESRGTVLRVGSLSTALYPASGVLVDGATEFGILYPYTFELGSTYSHYPPPEEIVPTILEFYASAIVHAEAVEIAWYGRN